MIKTAIVTGASTGIGFAITRLFLEKGMNVVMNAASSKNLEDALERLGSPKHAIIVPGDIGDKNTGSQLVNTAVERFGSLDILVNNAGVFGAKPFLAVTDSDLDIFYTTNFKGTYFTSQAAVERMIKAGGGSIVNVGSVLVDHAISGLPTTAAISIKGAIHAFTRQLAAEVGINKIRVNGVAPGVIRTALQGKMGIDNPDAAANLSLLNKIGEPAHIAEMVYALATNEFMTGEIINIDGGHVAGRQG